MTARSSTPPIGSSFESFLVEESVRDLVDEAAVKEVIASQVSDTMRQRGLSKSAMAEEMRTSRAQHDRLFDSANAGVALHTLYRAASVLGGRLTIELIDAE